LYAPMYFNGKIIPVKITVKEMKTSKMAIGYIH
jgi:hypothetical protein